MVGLDPQPRDRVLAICSSGDVALALAEVAREVVAVDCNPSQIEYAKERLQLIVDGKFDEFRARSRYDAAFFNNTRLERLAQRVGSIRFNVDDIFAVNLDGATKVYLSNALTYTSSRSPHNVTENLQRFADNLEPDSLIFTSDPSHRLFGDDYRWHGTPSGLRVDEHRTSLARRDYEGIGLPHVFRVL